MSFVLFIYFLNKCTFPWCKPIPASAKRVKSVAATTLLENHGY